MEAIELYTHTGVCPSGVLFISVGHQNSDGGYLIADQGTYINLLLVSIIEVNII